MKLGWVGCDATPHLPIAMLSHVSRPISQTMISPFNSFDPICSSSFVMRACFLAVRHKSCRVLRSPRPNSCTWPTYWPMITLDQEQAIWIYNGISAGEGWHWCRIWVPVSWCNAGVVIIHGKNGWRTINNSSGQYTGFICSVERNDLQDIQAIYHVAIRS